MPPAAPQAMGASSTDPDDLDRLLDYENAVEDFMKDLGAGDVVRDAPAHSPPHDEDQEIQVKRKRKPIPKLNEDLLLSAAGIPKLRKITKTKLKFRGKGHEYSDISRLLDTYQLWLDDLYPRAKFRDALSMVKKVGHTKRMQVYRKAWLDETKPNRREPTPEGLTLDDHENAGFFGDEQCATRAAQDDSIFPTSAGEGAQMSGALGPQGHDGHDVPMVENQSGPLAQTKRNGPFEEDDEDEADELDALLDGAPKPTAPTTGPLRRRGPFEEDDVDDDELDALLAARDASNDVSTGGNSRHTQTGSGNNTDLFADDEEALAEMGGMW